MGNNISNPEIINVTATDAAQVAKNPSEIANSIILNAAQQPTEDELQRKQLIEDLLKFRVSANDEFPPEVCLLEVDGVPFFAKGDIHAIKAKQKMGKTNAISIMVASILCGQWGRLKGLLENAKVLVIDTEQKDADAQTIYNRTLELAGLPKEDIYERFQTFALRALGTKEKLEAVKALIADFKPDIVFIDGVVDLMGNFNEVDDSKEIIEELMRMSTKEVSGIDPAIVCVLHTNKANEDHNMRGHAGTMLAQKAGNVLEVSKKEGIISVYSSDSRHQEVPTWSFSFDDDGNIIDADKLRIAKVEHDQQVREEQAAKRKEELLGTKVAKLLETIEKVGGNMPRITLRKSLEKALNLRTSSVNSLIANCIKDGIIVTDSTGKNVAIPTTNSANGNQQTLDIV